METKTKVSRSPKYKVSLLLPDKTHSKTGSTILEALEAIEPPQFFKAKAIITVNFGKLKAEVWMYPFQLRKLFVNPTSRQLLAKRLMLGLK